MLDKYTNIVNEFNILKTLNNDTELIYSNISFITTQLAFEYNKIIEEKDDLLLKQINNLYDSNLEIYNQISENIVAIVVEYENLIIEIDYLYKKALEDNQEEINLRYNEISDNIVNICELFNEIIEEKDDVVSKDITSLKLDKYKKILTSDIMKTYNNNVIKYNKLLKRAQQIIKDGPIIDTQIFNNLRKRIKSLAIGYNFNKINYDTLKINLENLATQYNHSKFSTQPNLYLNDPIIINQKYYNNSETYQFYLENYDYLKSYNYLDHYNKISKNIVSTAVEYENLIIEIDFQYEKALDDNQKEINHRYNLLSDNIIDKCKLFNEIIEEKNNISGRDLTTLELNKYKELLTSDIIKEYNKNVIEYFHIIEKSQKISKDGPILDTKTFNNLQNKIQNIVTTYNTNAENYNDLLVKIDTFHNLDAQHLYFKNTPPPNLFLSGPIMISLESFNYFVNKIKNIVAVYNNTLDVYNTTLISNISIIDSQIINIINKINKLETSLTYEGYVYKIRLFSILLNIFIKHFRLFSYDERWIKLRQIKKDYLHYLKNITTINSSFIVSLLHPIYFTPLLMYNDRNEIIMLKDNIRQSVNLNNYYGCIAPDLIKYNVKLLNTNIRENIKDSNINIFDISLDGNLYFNPDYRNKTYNIEIEAFSVLRCQLKFTFIVTENRFPPILSLQHDNIVRLGKVNNNIFLIDFKNYYNDENLLFMIETTNSINSNLSYDDIYEYKGDFINTDIPEETDVIKITPYLAGYPVLLSEYTNTIVELNVISVPKLIKEYITFSFDDQQTHYYDLNIIDKWFFNVNENSTINVIVDNVRENLKDSSLNVIGLQNNSILYFNPDYRGISYNINVTIESVDSYVYCNIIDINVTESSVPKPIRLSNNLLLEHLLIKENYTFNPNHYFRSITGAELNFNFDVLNITNNNISINSLFTLTNNRLRFTPDNRNIDYELRIYATDTIYNVKSDDYLEIKIREDKVLNKKDDIKPLYELGNIKQIIDVYEYIKLPDRQRYKAGLRYQITYSDDIRKSIKDERLVATIDSEGLLTINPDYRNMAYTINILVESYEYQTYRDFIEFTLNVSEREMHYPEITSKNILINNIVKNTRYDKTTKTLYVDKLAKDNVKINLSYFFESENSLRYEIVDNVKEDIYKVKDKVLDISPNVRDITHVFSIFAIDNIYNVFNSSNNNVLNVELTELHPVIVRNYKSTYSLSNIEQYINLDDIFKPVIFDDLLSYYVQYSDIYNIRPNIVDLSDAYKQQNNLLILQPDYRGIEYNLKITGFNENYFGLTKSIEINIVEIKRREVERLLNKLEVNLYRFNYEDSININLEDLYSHLKYYPEYELRLLDMNGLTLFNQYIDVNVGYLSISKVFDLNFSFQVVLYDLSKDIYLIDKAIIVRLVKSKQIKIVFKENEVTKDILIGDIGNNRFEIIGGNEKVSLKKNNKLTVTKGNYNFIFNLYDIITGVNIKQYYYKVL